MKKLTDYEISPSPMAAIWINLIVITLSILLAFALSGCQSVTRVEYYEATAQNAAYSQPTTEKTQGHGPVKSVEGKSGTPDFSDHKTFSLKFNILGI